MRRRLVTIRNGLLEPDFQVSEASLPSWLLESSLKGTYATLDELDRRAPLTGSGIRLTSPDGKSWDITIGNDGALSATAII